MGKSNTKKETYKERRVSEKRKKGKENGRKRKEKKETDQRR